MLERDIESYLVKEVKKLGGATYKFTSPSRRSVPDRIVIIPNGILCFVECKAPGCKATPAQFREIKRLRKLKQMVTVVDSTHQINELLKVLSMED